MAAAPCVCGSGMCVCVCRAASQTATGAQTATVWLPASPSLLAPAQHS